MHNGMKGLWPPRPQVPPKKEFSRKLNHKVSHYRTRGETDAGITRSIHFRYTPWVRHS